MIEILTEACGHFKALPTSKSRWANARVSRPVVDASSSIGAYVGFTCVQLVLATNSSVVTRTTAVQAGAEILTFTTMHARAANASFRSRFALFPIGTRRTSAYNQKGDIQNIERLAEYGTTYEILYRIWTNLHAEEVLE